MKALVSKTAVVEATGAGTFRAVVKLTRSGPVTLVIRETDGTGITSYAVECSPNETYDSAEVTQVKDINDTDVASPSGSRTYYCAQAPGNYLHIELIAASGTPSIEVDVIN